ncbi:hypothetical protein MMC18_003827 [Xylographa bjoerkii]|nr:hypothetical protein [Xylographa bjoerkii]
MSSSSNAVNGVTKRGKKKGSDDNQDFREPLYFGKLTGRIGSELDTLGHAQEALSAIVSLFKEYRTEVEVFERNFESMLAKDEEIIELKATVRRTTLVRDEKVEDLQRELESTAEDRILFQKERDDFEKVRTEQIQEFERSQAELKREENRLKEANEKKLKKRKDALEKESRETLTQLQVSNERLTENIVVLKAEFEAYRENSVSEKKDWSIVRSALDRETRTLQSELGSMRNEFALETRPDSFYKQEFFEIQEALKELSSKFFYSLPQSPGSKRRMFESVGKRCEIVEYAFLSESSVSVCLRLSAVEFLITNTLCELIWQPFAPGISPGETVMRARLETISQHLTRRATRAESTWRALTIYGLQASSAEHDLVERAIGRMLELLTPFTDLPSNDKLSEALNSIVRRAMNVWDTSQRDICKVIVQNSPDSSDDDGWMCEDSDLLKDFNNETEVDTIAMSPISPICIFPRILRVSSSAGASQTTIFRGRALFEDSRLLALGRKESLQLQRTMIDAHKQFASQRSGESGSRTGSDRRSSIAAQMARVGIEQ